MNNLLDTFLSNEGEGSTALPNPLAGINQLTELLSTVIIGMVIGLVVALIFMIILTVIRIRSQMATVAMQKDIQAIRQLLEQQTQSPAAPSSDAEIRPVEEKAAIL